MSKTTTFLLFCCCFLLFSLSLSAQISRFDNDSELWQANEDAIGHIVQFDPSMGNPPPSIYAEDSNTGLPWYFVAPDCFRGNRTYVYDDTLKYDFFTTYVGTTSYTNDVRIVGSNGMELAHNHDFQPAPGVWETFKIRMHESEWHIGTAAGPTPTQGEFLLVLSDIAWMEIRGEYMTGYDKGWLDNVWMGKVPDTTIIARICQGETYEFGKYEHHFSGTYLDELEAANGCDSLLVTLHLLVNPSSEELQKRAFCEGEFFTLPDGTTVSDAGIFTFQYTNAAGCDSTLVIDLTKHSAETNQFTTSICQGEQFKLPDGTYTTQSGIFQYDLQTVFGCDSSLTVEVVVRDTARSELSAVICGGDAYPMPNGFLATQPGIYKNVLQTPFGCDSTIVVALEVKDSSLALHQFERCLGEKVLLPDGSSATETGVFVFKYPNFIGCDSTLVFDVRFHPSFDTAFEVLLPEGTPYILPDGTRIVDTSLQKIYVFQTPFGCDSTVQVRVQYIYYNVFVPNVIQPDGNGTNDYFTLFTNESGREIKRLEIYDRWGELVFRRENFAPNAENLGWDGTFRGKDALAGVYAYWAEVEFVDGRLLFFKGDLTVLR